MKCPKCNLEIQKGWRFCPECNLAEQKKVIPIDHVAVICHQCQAPLSDESFFCSKCGANIHEDVIVDKTQGHSPPVALSLLERIPVPKSGAYWKMAMTLLFFLLLFSLFSGNHIGKITTINSILPTNQPEEKVVNNKPDLEVINDNLQLDWQHHTNNYIVGTVKNNTNKTYKYAQISINIYDKSETLLGSAVATVNHIESYGIWEFQAPLLYEDISYYRIKEVVGR